VPGIDGVVGLGLAGFVDGPGIGDGCDVATAKAEVLPHTTGGAAISKAVGHYGSPIVDSICKVLIVKQHVSLTRAGGSMA
jgi:hypothetical protein